MWWQELEAAGHTALSGSREICFTQCRALAHAVGPPAVKVDLPTVIARISSQTGLKFCLLLSNIHYQPS